MDFEDIGYNYRMTDSQACVGRTQMKKVLNWNLKRKDIAEKYFEGLKEIKGLSLPVPLKSDETVQSWYVKERNQKEEAFNQKSIKEKKKFELQGRMSK